MNRALAAGAAGMAVQQAILDSIAANLSNIDTPGFRADRPEFAALIDPGGRNLAATIEPPRRLFCQGKLETTNNPYDLAIDGEGLFEVRNTGGSLAYTRAGNFTPDAGGRLRLPCNAYLAGVTLPKGTVAVSVGSDGTLRAQITGHAEPVVAGRIRLCSFADNPALRLGSDGLFYRTASAGSLYRGAPGNGGFGSLKQRCLERANADVVGAMMAVLAAQRAYEANAKSVQAADEMLRLANNLERG